MSKSNILVGMWVHSLSKSINGIFKSSLADGTTLGNKPKKKNHKAHQQKCQKKVYLLLKYNANLVSISFFSGKAGPV